MTQGLSHSQSELLALKVESSILKVQSLRGIDCQGEVLLSEENEGMPSASLDRRLAFESRSC